MTTPGSVPADIPDLHAAVQVIDGGPNPAVMVRLTSGAGAFEMLLDARKAPQFLAGLADAVIRASGDALAAAGPQLLKPPAAGQLLVPQVARPR